ncbi:MAG: glycosyltransferase [Abditibacteriales bacterium]|nr:glycosyltransferase [Abditibacteriales bacterium]MDW8366660.1 glycosyltransferase [Abditibacteriales bacterium]
MNPKVSVIIPAYNCARYIAEAIDSVLAQTYRDFEIIVVDDGSTDGTGEVVHRYADRVRYIRQDNRGPSGAKNTGIQVARGEFISTLDGDDLWLPHRLEKLVPLLDRQLELGFVYGDCYRIDETPDRIQPRTAFEIHGGARRGWVLEELVMVNFVPSQSVLIRRCALDAVGLFDESYRIGEDWDLWLRLAARYPVDFVPEVVAMRRQHAQNITNNSDVTMMRNAVSILNNLRRREPEAVGRIRHAHTRALARAHFLLGVAYVNKGEGRRGRAEIARSLRYTPTHLPALGWWLLSWFGTGALKGLRHVKRRFQRPNAPTPQCPNVSL